MNNNIIAFVLLLGSVVAKSIIYEKRKEIIQDELRHSVGGNIILNEEEKKLNAHLMRCKKKELAYGLQNLQYFNFSNIFFEYKDYIATSKVYQIIKAMPKGALLHIHGNVILGPDFFVNATYKNGLFVCFEKPIKFKFSDKKPKDDCESEWKLMKKVREAAENITKFDEELRKNFTMIGTHDYKKPALAWKRFQEMFRVIHPIMSYRPVWEGYLYKALNALRKDNVMYVEMRLSFYLLYEKNGTVYDELYFVNVTKSIVDKFVREHPNFFGAKIIITYSRHGSGNPERIEQYLNITKIVKRAFPNFVAGFDLVGPEDLGSPLVDFLPQLENAKTDLDYFFHAGETDWFGMSVDENLVDAVLLGTKRIGHGFALLKHPRVLEEVKKKGIAVEVCVISNQVLGYVHDERNHPLAEMLANNIPVTISSDDPGLWESDPLSMDFYVAFVGVASAKQDLRLLKQLALNSLKYSVLSASEKNVVSKMFDTKWSEFVHDSVRDILVNNGKSVQHKPSNTRLFEFYSW